MRILTIGRKSSDPAMMPDIVLPDLNKDISRLQAELTITDSGEYYLVDCGGGNPTMLRVLGRWEKLKQDFVKPEDELKFGTLQMTVRDLAALAPAEIRQAAAAVPFTYKEPLSRNLKPRRNPANGEVEYVTE
jgi:hypothetical protein